jgi:hypothetical protein
VADVDDDPVLDSHGASLGKTLVHGVDTAVTEDGIGWESTLARITSVNAARVDSASEGREDGKEAGVHIAGGYGTGFRG